LQGVPALRGVFRIENCLVRLITVRDRTRLQAPCPARGRPLRNAANTVQPVGCGDCATVWLGEVTRPASPGKADTVPGFPAGIIAVAGLET